MDAEKHPFIKASPNPVLSGPDLGKTELVWSSGSDNEGEIYVFTEEEGEKLLAKGSEGHLELDWIKTGILYEIRLYIEHKLAATETISRTNLIIGEAEVSDDAIYNMISTSRNHLWLIAAPKSGSTWLSRILLNYLEWPEVSLIYHYDHREQEVDVRKLLSHKDENIFTPNQHCRVSSATLDFIKKARVSPVLLVRNIYDSVFSNLDHYNSESVQTPMAFMDNHNWEKLSDSKKVNYLVDLLVPWYFNFYAGWFSSELKKSGELCVLTYEELKEDPFTATSKVLNHFHIEISDAKLKSSIELTKNQNTRRNVAKIGRGSRLTKAQKRKIQKLCSYYPEIDFSIIGL
ncbi:MAG: sulfotransferase domain-containing protein [Chloroflexota bacterium]